MDPGVPGFKGAAAAGCHHCCAGRCWQLLDQRGLPRCSWEVDATGFVQKQIISCKSCFFWMGSIPLPGWDAIISDPVRPDWRHGQRSGGIAKSPGWKETKESWRNIWKFILCAHTIPSSCFYTLPAVSNKTCRNSGKLLAMLVCSSALLWSVLLHLRRSK